MSAFPTPYTVGLERFRGDPEDLDDLGNEIEDWDPAVNVRVIAWQASSVESLTGYASRVVADVDMAVPPTLVVGVRDRFTLPGETDSYEVTAIEDANHGFHQWHPGTVVKLKRVTG